MTDTTTNQRTTQPTSASVFMPVASQSFVVGTVVAQDAAAERAVVPANAGDGDLGVAWAMGVAIGAGVAGEPGPVQFAGPVRLTTAQWDAVTGESGGLVTGASYFVSATEAGKLSRQTSITPGDFISYVGTATSPQDLFLAITFPLEIT